MRNKKLIKLLFNKDKIISILLIVEFVCIFILFYNMQKDFKLIESIKAIEKYEWNQEGAYSVGIGLDSNFNNKDASLEDIVKFYNELKMYENTEHTGLLLSEKVTTQWVNGDYKKDIYIPYSVNSNIEVENEDGDSHLTMPIRICDVNYLNAIETNVKYENRVEKNNKRYVILGDKFKSMYNIGDNIKLDNEEKIKFEIMEFCNKNTVMTYSKNYFEEYPFIDGSMIILLNEDDLMNGQLIREILLLNTMNIKFIEGDYEKFKSDILKIGEKNNLRVSMTNNKESLSKEIEKLEAQIKFSVLRTMLFLTAAFCSAIGTIIYSIYEFRKELGIVIVIGARKKDLFIINTIKIFVIGTIGFIIATIMNYYGYINICGNGWYIVKSTLNDFILTFFMFIIILIIVLIYPLIKILKINIVNLVGGKR